MRGIPVVVVAVVALLLGGLTPALAGVHVASRATPAGRCVSGAHTLSRYGDHVYPETGNGGYTSVHTRIHMVYDAVRNEFLRGNRVALTERAGYRCLHDFSLDFERHSPFADGPDMHVSSVTVDGRRASFRFVRPTYPGDPRGWRDPDPWAHQAGQNAVVGGPHHNPLPPACSPEVPANAKADSLDGTSCPANKLVITPSRPVRAWQRFVVRVRYTGHPGVHQAGDGTTDGWFRSDVPKGDGGFVTTEPAGSEDWMPLNDHPSAKPTYDFDDTVTRGRTVLANGVLRSVHRHRPDARFPHGSVTWRWHMAYPVASYLVENSVGEYDLTQRTVRGVKYYVAQASSLSRKQKRKNLAIMKQQPDIVAFQSRFNGPFPFSKDGVVVGRPSASFEEEMEGMITFAGGTIDLDTLNHENMHQWWGDNVSEANYRYTFLKEGLATFGEYLFHARNAAKPFGGLGTARGHAAFDRDLRHTFANTYAHHDIWRQAPNDPTSATLFDGAATYTRPGLTYVALRQILGDRRFGAALRAMQRRYGGATFDERQLETSFGRYLPTRSTPCRARLRSFFTQWFDTAYPTADTPKPTITGTNFYAAGCVAPR